MKTLQKAGFLILFLSTTITCIHDIKSVETSYSHTIPAIQGLTNENQTSIALLTDKNVSYKFSLKEIGRDAKKESILNSMNNEITNEKPLLNTYKVSFSKHPKAIQTVHVDALEPKKHYLFIVRDSENTLIDWRRFSSLDTKTKNWAVAIASCMSDAPQYQEAGDRIWHELLSHNPNVVFLIGDTVYPDYDKNGNKMKNKITPPHQLWKRHVEAREQLKLFRMSKLTPVLAVWDDHDYGVNNGGKDYPYKNEAHVIFKTFFPRSLWPKETSSMKVSKNHPAIEKQNNPFAIDFNNNPSPSKHIKLSIKEQLKPLANMKGKLSPLGMALHWEAFGQSFLFADNRTFRTLKDVEHAHWGKNQEDWILKTIAHASQTQGVWLINGGQFWGAYHRWESYEGHHPKNFKTFIKKLGQIKTPVWFISGDRHLAELQKIDNDLPYTSYELTTSGIHARIPPPSILKEYPNPRQIEAVAGKYNYAMVKSVPSRDNQKGLNLDVDVFGLDETVLFSKKLHINQNPETTIKRKSP